MFRRSTMAAFCGLAASALLLGASPAAAGGGEERPSRTVLRDGTGDVWKVNWRTSHWTLVGDLPPADVRRAVVRHGRRALVVRTRFDDLRRVGTQKYWTGVSTPEEDYFAEVVSKPGGRSGRHVLDGPGGVQTSCARLTHRIDYEADLVTLRVPRSCLGSPRWVRVNIGNLLVVVDEGSHRRHYADNPHDHGPYANVGTRRLHRSG